MRNRSRPGDPRTPFVVAATTITAVACGGTVLERGGGGGAGGDSVGSVAIGGTVSSGGGARPTFPGSGGTGIGVEPPSYGGSPPWSTCPDQAPQNGVSCVGNTSCEYPLGRPCSSAFALCTNEMWNVTVGVSSACNAPCPLVQPATAQPCNYVGAPCSYGSCPASLVTVACIAQSWQVDLAPCNPPPISGDASVEGGILIDAGPADAAPAGD